MRITIGGVSGSGKDTVARLLSEKLHLKIYNVGEMRRKIAEKMGISLAQLNSLGEKEDFTDRQVDEEQGRIGRTEEGFIMVGRMAYHFIPSAVKIFLSVDIEEGSRRILKDINERGRTGEGFKNLDEAIKATKERELSDRLRYKKWYGLDPYDPSQYDIVIDTTELAPEEVVQRILEALAKKQHYQDF